MFLLADIESLTKTRRSVLIASISTLIIAGLQISSNEISLIGFQVLLSQENMVTVARAVTVYLIIVFGLQSIPEVVKSSGALWDLFIRAEERKLWRGHSKDWGHYDDDGYPYSGDPQEDDAADIRMRIERKRHKKDSRINSLMKISMFLVHFVIFYLWPITLAFLAISWPTAIGYLLK